MDCRISLMLGLGLGVLGGAAGCTPSLFTRTSTDPVQSSVRKDQATPVAIPENAVIKKEADLPKRKPKAMTCVSFGDFRLREAEAPEKSPDEKRQMRLQGKRAYEQALEIDPRCVDAHRGLANFYDTEGDHARAITSLRNAVRVSPQTAGLWLELGMLHSRHKEWELAIEALGHAADLERDNRQYANVLGFCLARAGRHDESLTYFTQVVGEAGAYYNVGRMMIHNGQVDAGKKHLQQALQKEPKLTEAAILLTELDQSQNSPAQGVVPVQYEEPLKP